MSKHFFINNVKFVHGYVEHLNKNSAGFYIDIAEMKKYGFEDFYCMAKVMINTKHGAVGFVFEDLQKNQTILIPSKKLTSDELNKIIELNESTILVVAGTKEGLAIDADTPPLIIGS